MGKSDFASKSVEPQKSNFETLDPQNLPDINFDKGSFITGFDVKSLYPSLRDIDTACLARESVIHSNIKFENFGYDKALAFLRIMAGPEILRSAGLSKFIPKWKGDKVDSLRVTGQSGRKMENWEFSPHVPTIFEEKLILGLVIEVGVLVAMGSHIYEFAGKYYYY